MAATYAVYTSPTHTPIPNHLPTLIVTPHGQPSNILYSYLHTNFNAENYLLTPSPQGDLCVAKLFPPRHSGGHHNSSASDPGHGGPASNPASKVVRCEASRNLKWSIVNTGVMSPIYKLSLPSPDSTELPLFQISKPNPNAPFWSMFYFAYAGHLIPPKRIEFGKIQRNPPGPGGGGTRISITGKTPEEKAVWATLGEGNEDCVEWVVLCAALNLLDDEILKAAERNPPAAQNPQSPQNPNPSARPAQPQPAPARGPAPAQQPGQPMRGGALPGQRPGQPISPPAGRPAPGPGQIPYNAPRTGQPIPNGYAQLPQAGVPMAAPRPPAGYMPQMPQPPPQQPPPPRRF